MSSWWRFITGTVDDGVRAGARSGDAAAAGAAAHDAAGDDAPYALSVGETASLDQLGIAPSLVEFVQEMGAGRRAPAASARLTAGAGAAKQPATWQHFPIDDELARIAQLEAVTHCDDAETHEASPKHKILIEHPFELTPHRLQHALIMLKRVPALRALRYEMCPRHMTEERFWHIYFLLIADSLDKRGCEALLNPRMASLTSSKAGAVSGVQRMARAALRSADVGVRPMAARSSVHQLRALTEPNVENMGIWEFITATEHDSDADMDEYERYVFDPTVYLRTGWKREYLERDALLRLRANLQLGVLMRRGVPEWLGPDARAAVWAAACGVDRLRAEWPEQWQSVCQRVFGPHVPERCVRIPTFGGWYRPDQHTALSAAQLDAASRVLVALALDNTDVPYAPQLPDLCMLLLRYLDEEATFRVVTDMLRRSRCFERRSAAGGAAAAHDDARHAHGGAASHGKRSKAGGKSVVAAAIEHTRLGSVDGRATLNGNVPSGTVAYMTCSVHSADALGGTFMEILEHCVPELAGHLKALRVGAADFAEAWLKRFFVGSLPESVVLRVVDAFLIEGLSVLHTVGVALLHLHCDSLLECGSADSLLNSLRAATRRFDNGELLMQTAYSCSATRSLMARLHRKHADEQQTAQVAAAAPALPPSSPSTPQTARRRSGQASLTASRSASVDSGGAADGNELRSAETPRTVSNIGFYRPRIRQLSRVLSQQEFEIVWSWLPTQWRVQEPDRVFSTRENGCSLTSFYACCSAQEAPMLMLLKSRAGAKFGAFVSYGWNVNLSGYYGSGQSFVFRLQPRPAVYRWKPGQGELFQLAARDRLAIGGNAIWLDDELHHGRSEPGDTFANESLLGNTAKDNSFECTTLEVYRFVDRDFGDIEGSE